MTPEGSDSEALTRPFDTDEREALLDRVMERLDRGAEKPAVEKVVDLQERRSRSPGTIVLAVLVAAAAALLLWFVMQPSGVDRDPKVASLPEYAFTELRGGIAAKRSGDELPEELRLHADDEIDWVLTPAQPVRGGVVVAVLAEPQQGDARLVELHEVRVSKPGAVRIEGKLSDHVALEPGEWTLTVLIAAPGGLPGDVEAARAGDGDRWRAASVRAIILPP